MGFYDEYGEWVEEEEISIPSIHTKVVQAIAPSKHKQALSKQAQASTSKHTHPSPGTLEGRVKGGRNRALKLSSKKRREIAKKAAYARWGR